MIIHEGYANLNLVNPVVTIGIFDGVHRGHRILFDNLVSRAKEMHGESVVITFYPHPRLVLSENISDLYFLSSPEEKTGLIEETGIDHLIIIPFNHEFSNIEAYDFVENVLIKKIGTKHLIVGFNHHFGRQGKGDYNTINQCAEKLDFKVEQIQALNTETGTISSSVIRERLLNGDLEEANRLLGYDYFMNGRIVTGKQLGKEIGYPTANIKPDYVHKLVPKDGVYAVEVYLEGKRHPGMLSIGLNPTVNTGNDPKTIEVNIFDFKKNIYGSKIRIVYRYRLRDEIKFDTISELKAQLEDDKNEAKKLLT
jgi:riboflavin kinase/FMN adenylyltransferase